MICLNCSSSMQEHSPDKWNCPGCGFEAQQLSIEGLVELVQFNKTTPVYSKINTYTMSPAEREALEARQRDKQKRDRGKDIETTAPQQGFLGGHRYRKRGGER